MRPPQLRRLLAAGVVLLAAVGPSEGFLELVVGYFFGNYLWGAPAKIGDRVSQAALAPAQSLLLGGGTEIVSQALTHDYIPGMRDFVWRAVGTAVSQLGSLAVSAIWWFFSSVGAAIGQSLGTAIPAAVAAANAIAAAIASIIAAAVNNTLLQGDQNPAMQLQVVTRRSVARRSSGPTRRWSAFCEGAEARSRVEQTSSASPSPRPRDTTPSSASLWSCAPSTPTRRSSSRPGSPPSGGSSDPSSPQSPSPAGLKGMSTRVSEARPRTRRGSAKKPTPPAPSPVTS
nr:uncharacterized protein LOC113805949 [Penaeus vannamei]